jgi:hypothetical protein
LTLLARILAFEKYEFVILVKKASFIATPVSEHQILRGAENDPHATQTSNNEPNPENQQPSHPDTDPRTTPHQTTDAENDPHATLFSSIRDIDPELPSELALRCLRRENPSVV